MFCSITSISENGIEPDACVQACVYVCAFMCAWTLHPTVCAPFEAKPQPL